MGLSDLFKTKKESAEITYQTEQTFFASPEQMQLTESSTKLFAPAPYESVLCGSAPPPEVSVQKDKGKHQLMPTTAADIQTHESGARLRAQKSCVASNVALDEDKACVDEEMKDAFALMKQYAGLKTDAFSYNDYKAEEALVRSIVGFLVSKEQRLSAALQGQDPAPETAAELLKLVQMYKLFFLETNGKLQEPAADQIDRDSQQYKDLRKAGRNKRTAKAKLSTEVTDTNAKKQLLEQKPGVKSAIAQYEQLKEDYEKEYQRFGGTPEDVGSTDVLEEVENKLSEFESRYIKGDAVASAEAKLQLLRDRLVSSPEDADAKAELEKLESEYDVMQYFVVSEALKTKSAQLREADADYANFLATFPKIYQGHNDKNMTISGDSLVNFLDKTKDVLFPHPPSVADIMQGELGDCYLLAALASIVTVQPEAIKESMRDNGDGTVTVRFFYENVRYNNTNGEVLSSDIEPHYVTVKKETPLKKSDSGSNYEAYAQRALWVQMVERAYVASKLHLGYSLKRLESQEYIYNSQSKQAEYAAKHDEIGKKMNDPNTANYSDIVGGDEGDFTFVITGRKAKAIRTQEQVSSRRLDLMYNNVMLREGNLALKGNASTIFKGDAVIDSTISQQTQSVQTEYTDLYAAINADLAHLPGVMTFPAKDKSKPDITVLGRFANSDEMQAYLLANRSRLISAISLRAWITDPKKQLRAREQVFDNLVTQLVTEAKRGDAFKPYSTTQYSDNANETFKQIEKALADGEIVTCGTHKYIPKDADISGGGLNSESMSGGIVEGHAYSALGTMKSANGFKYIKLRNPWANTVRTYMYDESTKSVTGAVEKRRESDGVFYLELNDFIARFNQVQRN